MEDLRPAMPRCMVLFWNHHPAPPRNPLTGAIGTLMNAGVSLIPQRRSLVEETIEVLAGQIAAGAYGGVLPAERTLCERLQVGRNTVRAALHKLESDGWIAAGEPGKRRRILRRKRKRRRGTKPLLNVFMLSGDPFGDFSARPLLVIDLLREHLADAGCRMSVHALNMRRATGVRRNLETLVRAEPAGIWVLQSCPWKVQSWFEHDGLPAVVLGYADPAVSLPYLTVDLHAVGRHLAGQLRVGGHARAALLQSVAELHAHQLVSEAVEAGLGAAGDPGGSVLRVVHDGTKESICRELDRLLRMKKNRPSAIIVITTHELTTALTCLLARGVRIPEEMSIVSLLDDPIIPHLVPEVTRYTMPYAVMVKRLFQMLRSVSRRGVQAVRPARLMSEFVRGQTLGPAPAGRRR